MAERKNMRIPEARYWSLSPIGKELHDYWMKFKPEMYREMALNGTLLETLEREDERLFDLILELMRSGMAEDQAKEVARAEIYDGTPD